MEFCYQTCVFMCLKVHNMVFQSDDDRALWQRLESSGLMEEQLIGQVCPEFAAQKDALLKLMEKFDLICERLPRKHVRSRHS